MLLAIVIALTKSVNRKISCPHFGGPPNREMADALGGHLCSVGSKPVPFSRGEQQRSVQPATLAPAAPFTGETPSDGIHATLCTEAPRRQPSNGKEISRLPTFTGTSLASRPPAERTPAGHTLTPAKPL